MLVCQFDEFDSMYLVLSTPHFVYNFEKRGRMQCSFPMSFVISFKSVTRKPNNSVCFRISFRNSAGKIFFLHSHIAKIKNKCSSVAWGLKNVKFTKNELNNLQGAAQGRTKIDCRIV